MALHGGSGYRRPRAESWSWAFRGVI
jgi:hypothetical protein